MPLYKIGEEVTLVPREKYKHYRCIYIDQMVDLAGKKGHITEIFNLDSLHSKDFPFIVDKYGYRLDLPGSWAYSAEMFEESYEM